MIFNINLLKIFTLIFMLEPHHCGVSQPSYKVFSIRFPPGESFHRLLDELPNPKQTGLNQNQN